VEWGLRGGFRFGDPEQLVIGAQANVAEVAENLRFVPMVDFGFMDDVLILTGNGDFQYHLLDSELGTLGHPYLLAGIAIVYYNFDLNCEGFSEPFRSACEDASTSTDVAFNFGGGIESDEGWFGEFRATVEDGSFFQIAIGKTFN
jgi:hypothetical protein